MTVSMCDLPRTATDSNLHILEALSPTFIDPLKNSHLQAALTELRHPSNL